MSRYGLLLAFTLVLAASTRGQFVEQIDVAVANVDVVVTDRDGNLVRGLTKDDFTLYENGKAQVITNFTAFDAPPATPAASPNVSSPAAPAEAAAPHRARLVVLFVDIDEIEPVARKRFFDGVSKYLDAAMRPGDFLTLLTWSKRVRVALPPTSDQRVIDEAVRFVAESNRWSEDELRRRLTEIRTEESRLDAAFASSLGQSAPSPDAEMRFQEWLVGEERCAQIKRKLREIRSLVVSLARVDLQKVVLFASDDLTLRTQSNCSLIHQLDDLANTANAYGLTLHAFHPPGARDRNVMSPESAGTFAGGGGNSAPAAEYTRMFEQSSGLLHLAHRTGGRVGIGPGESIETLQRAAAELDTYYSLGYRLSPGKEDKPRKIKVVTKDPSHRIRTRDSVMRVSETVRLRDRVSTNLYMPDPVPSASLAFTPKIVQIRREGKWALADVVLTIPAKMLVMLQDGQKLRGSFSVLVAAGRDLGDTSDVTELKQDFDSKVPPAEGSVITYKFSIKMRPDSQRLSIALRDNLSGDVATKLVMLEK